MNERVENPWHPYPEAPDVSEIHSAAQEEFARAAAAILIGGGIGAAPAAGLFRNMIRLLVRSCEEYKAAVAEHVAAIEHGSFYNLINASSHWEGCIEALHRCMNIAEVFRRKLGQWAPQDDNLRIDKAARFTNAEIKPVRLIRDAVQHIEEELQDFRSPEEDSGGGWGFFIHCDAEGICFHGSNLSYAQLADYLQRVLDLSHWLNMQNPPLGHPLADPDRTIEINHIGSKQYKKPYGS